MKILILVLAIFTAFSLAAFSDESTLPDSFKDFQKIGLEIDKWNKGTVFIPKHVKYVKPDNESIQCKIANIDFEIRFGSGPSEGPLFSISATSETKTHTKAIVAEKLFISDSGNIFAESRYGHYFNQKLKYIITKKGIEEQRQPFYLVDEPCKVNETLILTSQRCAKGETIAVIPKGQTVRVLLDDNKFSKEPCD